MITLRDLLIASVEHPNHRICINYDKDDGGVYPKVVSIYNCKFRLFDSIIDYEKASPEKYLINRTYIGGIYGENIIDILKHYSLDLISFTYNIEKISIIDDDKYNIHIINLIM